MGNAGMRTGLFLQVRMASTRLPEKAVLPLKDGNVIEHAMWALRNVPVDVHALLTDVSSAGCLQQYADAEQYELFAGPERDVLKRYCLAAEYFDTDVVIRACGDDPAVSARLAKEILQLHCENHADLSHFLHIPLGTGVEIINRDALIRAESCTSDPFEREHLTTHMYRNRNIFRVLEVPCNKRYSLPDTRVTLDTPADYTLISRLYRDLYQGKPLEIDEVVWWLRRNAGTDESQQSYTPHSYTACR